MIETMGIHGKAKRREPRMEPAYGTAKAGLSKRKLGKHIHGRKEPGLGVILNTKRKAF